MNRVNRAKMAGVMVVLATTLVGRSAFAQADIAGSWSVRYHEDFWYRQAGPEMGDFMGIPLNDDGRQMANSYSASIWSQHGYQCRPHPAQYAMRGPANIRISKHTVTPGDRLVAYEIYGTFGGAVRMIWMDGRPHPPEYARHTWMGFSTGRWEGDMLTVTTTHLRKGYIQRDGVDSSDQATLTEHFFRYGDNGQYLMVVSIVNDPIYLAEPFIRTTNWGLALNQGVNPQATGNECGTAETVDEIAGLPKGYVSHFLPGTNDDQLHEVEKKYGIPFEATQGFPETLYPEYAAKVKLYRESLKSRTTGSPLAGARSTEQTGFVGSWRLDRVKSTFTESERRTGLTSLGVDATSVEWRTMKIEAVDNGFKHTTDTRAIANDTGFFREEYTARFDGRDYPIDLKATALDTVSLKRVDANTIERIGKVAGDVTETATWKLSPDGRVLTITVKGKVPGGVEYSSVQVFNRE